MIDLYCNSKGLKFGLDPDPLTNPPFATPRIIFIIWYVALLFFSFFRCMTEPKCMLHAFLKIREQDLNILAQSIDGQISKLIFLTLNVLPVVDY